MNKRLLLALFLLAVIGYFYVMADEDDEPVDDGGTDWQSRLLHFLESMAIMMGTDFVLKGAYKFLRDRINKMRNKGIKTNAEKEAEKIAEKEAEKITEKEAEKIAEKEAMAQAEKEAERLAEEELERLAQKPIEELTEKEAEKLAQAEAEKLAKKEAERLAQEEADKLAEKEAEKVATAEAERLAKLEAERIAKAQALHYLETMTQQQLLAHTAEELAVHGLERVGEKGMEKVVLKVAEKVSVSVFSKLFKMLGGPFEWISFLFSTTLYLTLGLDSEMFDECPSDEWSFTHLPYEVLMVIQAIPFFGDAWQLIAELICFDVGKCPEGKEPSNTHMSCYDKCKDGYKSDGEAICYKQYPGFEDRGFPMAPTTTSITLDVQTNTGFPANACPPGQTNDNGICRVNCRQNYHAVGPLCWADSFTVGNGVGTPVELAPCGADQRDDGTVCWAKSGEVCADDCSKGWDGCRRRFLGGCVGGCPMSCSGVYLGARTELSQRRRCPPGKSLGSDPGSLLCYDDCPPGFHHPAGLPNQCYANGDASYENGVGEGVPGCPPGSSMDSAGLCYNDAQPGWHKTTLGMKSEMCPEGSTDFGVGCTRESYPRGGLQMAFNIHMKKRNHYYDLTPDQLPPGF